MDVTVIVATLIGAVSLMGVVVIVLKNSSGIELDVLSDYKDIKNAIIEYRKKYLTKEKKLEDVRQFLPNSDIDLSRYRVSPDDRYLIVDMKGIRGDGKLIAEVAGGTSSYDPQTMSLELSLVNMAALGKVKPEARFKITPDSGIFTTTELVYDYSESIAEDNEILDVKWENNKKRFSRPGLQTIKLKVLDKNGIWSDWSALTIEIKDMPGLNMLASSINTIIVVHNDGRIDGMGLNEFGQLGNGMVTPQRKRKVSDFIENIASSACGENHTLFLSHDGEVMSTGRNIYGQLGTGGRADLKTPKTVWGLQNVKQISCGDNFSLALQSDGSVFGWGDNEHCQLGTDKFNAREMPTKIEELYDIQSISCGNEHALVIASNGKVYGWGANTYGQLGIDGKNTIVDPTLLPFNNAYKIIGGKNTTFVIRKDGTVLASGQNGKCQLGLKGKKEYHEPVVVPGLKGIIDIKMRGGFALALDALGNVFTWGQYAGLYESVIESPTKIPGIQGAKHIATTSGYGYAITSDDKLAKWSGKFNKIDVLDINDGDDDST